MVWNSTSGSHVKLTIQIQFALDPYGSFFINNYNMTASSVEKHCLVLLNVKLQ